MKHPFERKLQRTTRGRKWRRAIAIFSVCLHVLATLATASVAVVNPPPLQSAIEQTLGKEAASLLPAPSVARAAAAEAPSESAPAAPGFAPLATVGGLTITTSGCYPSGGLSKSTVQVEVPWTGLVNGNTINVVLTSGATTLTRTIRPESTANPIKSPQVVAFEIDADGAPFTVTATDSSGSVQTGAGVAPPPCQPLVCNAGDLGGKVFNDYDGNGVQAAGEYIGVANIDVAVFDRLDNLYTTTTDTDGAYKFTSIPAGNYPTRVEFSNIPAIYGQGTPIGTGNKSTVQFASAASCATNLALLNPADYSEPNPLLVTPMYRRGNPTAPGAAMGTLSTLFAMPANANGTGSDYYSYLRPTGTYSAAIASQTGSIWGLAWSKSRQTLYTSAVLRRYAGLGPLGIGGIYQWDKATNKLTPFVDVTTLGIDVGQALVPSNVARKLITAIDTGISNQSTTPMTDTSVTPLIATTGIGDIDISDDGNVLYFINLYQGTAHSYNLNSGQTATYTLPDANCVGGVQRPWATKIKDGYLYVGLVCDASVSQSKGDMRAKIYRMDLSGNTFSSAPILDFPLSYPKGSVGSGIDARGGWFPWVPQLTVANSWSGAAVIRPTPILMDIEFDVDGSMVMAFGDRASMQSGWMDYAYNNEGNGTSVYNLVGGDILRAYSRGGVFVLENNAKAGPNTGAAPNNNQGPGFGEFYNENLWNVAASGHSETFVGGIALRPGSGEVIGTVMDPTNLNTNNSAIVHAGGLRTWSNTTGLTIRKPSIYTRQSAATQAYATNGGASNNNFGKSAGMGDIELLSDIPRYQEVSTRLWDDVDGDGIQDANESPKAGVVVVLYDLAGNPIVTGTTDINGVVTFMSSTDPRLLVGGIYENPSNIPPNTSVVTGLVPGQQYVLRVPLDQPLLTNNQASPTNSTGVSAVPTQIDSDGVRINSNGSTSGGFSEAYVSWPTPGSVENSVDFGFIPPRSALQIIKGITGGPSVADPFTVTVSGPNQFITTTTIAVGITRTLSNLLPGFYTVQEELPPPPDAPPGYTWSGNIYAPSNGEIILQAEMTGTLHVTNTLLAQPPGAGTLNVTKMLSWFNIEPPLSSTFQITLSGPSFPTGQLFSIMSGTVGITNLIPGVYTVAEISPGNGWVTTYTVEALDTLNNAVITVTNDLTSTLSAAGDISGSVYNDLDMNGAQGIGEGGVAGVSVAAYDRDGILRGSATTDASGNYTLTATGNGPYRVEFSGLPQGYQPSPGETSGAVSLQEVASGAVTGVNFAVAIPSLYCQNNPDIAAALCNNGDSSGNGGSALVSFPSTASGTSGSNTVGATAAEIGTVWGTAYQRTQQYLYAAANLQRHKGLGPEGEDGVYVVDYSGGAPTVAGSFNLNGITPQNGGSAINLGTVNRSSAANGLAASNYTLGTATTASIDLDAYAKVGKVGFGGMAIDEGGNGSNLWAVNLNQATLIKMDISGGLGSLPGTVRAYDLAGIAGYPTCAMTTPQGAITQRINVGGTPFTDSGGRSWVADGPFVSGGSIETSASAVSNLNNLYEGTRDLALYQSRRTGAVSSAISVTNGTYQVILHFAELTNGSTVGSRQFNISAEGQPLSTDYDIFVASPGGVGRAITYQFKLAISDGVLNLDLANGTDGDSPMLSAIEVIPVTGQSGALRPWALTMHGGLGYLGAVCDASNSLNPADLKAYVFSFNPANPSLGLTTVISFGLSYGRESMAGIAPGEWSAWRTVAPEFGWAGEANYRPGAAQPILSDIAFTQKGDMVLGFADRAAMQRAPQNFTPFAGSTTASNEPISMGDLVQVCKTASGYLLEGQAGCATSDPGTGGSSSDGASNNGEYYFNDGSAQGAFSFSESSLGGLAYLPSSNEIVNSALDPVDNVAANERVGSGVQFHNSLTGARSDAYRVQAGNGGFLSPSDFLGASNAMGNLELLCEAAPIEIGNRVWYDQNGNGRQDPGEPGLGGVTVQLQGPTGISSTLSDGAGYYRFENLRPFSQYTLTVAVGQVALNTYQATQANASAISGSAISNNPVNDVRDSDGLLVGNDSTIYYQTGNAGVSNHGLDFGFTRAPFGAVNLQNVAPPQVTVGDRLWFDTNNDGIDNDGAGGALGSGTGITGAAVELYQDTNGDGVFTPGVDQLISTTTTSASGYYSFTGVAETNSPTTTYMVVITSSNFSTGPLADYRNSNGNGTSAPDVDTNSDPNDDNGDEIGLPGSSSFVVASKPFTLTAGSEPTGEGNPIGSTYSDADTNATPSFGFYKLQLGNLVWDDLNNDGIRDAGEPGKSGITVTLYAADGTTVISTTTTNANGNYTFTNLISATYIVGITPVGGYTSSLGAGGESDPNSNINDVSGSVSDNGVILVGNEIRSNPITLTPGDTGSLNNNSVVTTTGTTSNPTLDFALWQPLTFGDFVWEDLNHNGVQDPGEPGIAGVLVTLQTPTGTITATTNSSGFYTFTNLISGTYSVSFTTPSGYTGTLQNVGNDSFDSDANPITGFGGTINLGPNGTDLTIDAGFWRPATLGNRVWEDLDHNGVQDPGEPGIPGVSVTLRTVTGTITTQTDANGNYTFTNLISATYGLTFSTPSGYTSTTSIGGINVADNSDANPSTGAVSGIVLNAGETNLNVDAGFWRPATVGDRVWEDLNHDGLQDPDEFGIEGVLVTLQTPTGTLTTTTNASGNYSFTNLISGTYALTFTAPAGYTSTLQGSSNPNDGSNSDSNANPITGAVGSFSVTPGSNNPTVDAGFWQPSTLGNRVWEDLNHDGIQDVGEPGISGVLVTLQTPTGIVTMTTDGSGNYTFTNLIPGTYPITFTAPSNYTFTQQSLSSPNDGNDDDSNADPLTGFGGEVIMGPNESNVTVDAGLWRPASLGDRVWEDLNHDGIQDVGEPGIPGVLVTLQTPNGTISTQTDVNGNYTFTNLISGTYGVTFTAPSGYTGTLSNIGNDAFDSDGNPLTGGTGPITVNAGDTITNVDAGFWQPASLGDRVWEDLNHDGIQDVGEPGIPGVLVTLQTPNGTISTQTDVNGNYTFTNLISGTYGVTFTAPSGYTGTLANVGNDAFDSDGNPLTGGTGPITVNAGDAITNVDAGFWQPASLGDRVWEDLNHDGVQDVGEPGISGVLVTLQTPNGTISTQTDVNGNYTFTNLISGTYGVTFTAPSGYTGTLSNIGNDGFDSDGDPLTGGTGPIMVNAGDTITNVDAGFWQPASLGDRVWEDLNHDGIQDVGEPGISGVLVTLQTPNGIVTTTTDSSGNYSFTNLISGTYGVTFTAPSGYTGTLSNIGNDTFDSDGNPLTGGTGPITVNAGDTITNVDAGFWQPASLGDRVWEDLNHDGIQDVGEPGIPGVLVTLQTPSGVVTTTTDSSGNYSFTNLISGTYGVTFTAPSGYTGTVANIGNDTLDSDGNPLTGGTGPITVNAGDTITNVDVGFWQPASLGDRVWEDLNHDGIQDVGEPGIPGVLVTLQTPNGTISTQTDVNGNYTFTNLISGTYGVTFTAPSGYTGTLSNIGNDTLDSDGNPLTGGTGPITVNAGDAITNVDAGFWQPASLGDRVWEDLNHDGVQDVGEPGIPGVLVTLQTPNGTISTQTDVNGNYTFTNLISGTYGVTFTAPSGYTGTLSNIGNDTFDSDGNPLTGGTGPITVNAGDTITNVDAGFWQPASLGDRVWEDLNHDGIQDVGEPGIPGVLVTLQTPNGVVTTTTNANGNYSFTNLISGTYGVTFTAPSGYTGTLSNIGNDGFDSDGDPLTGGTGPITVNTGDAITNVDAGFWQPASLGDRVWEDLNHDGVQDVGEPGIPGVLVTLQTPNGVVTTTTNANGNYSFTNLISGTYGVTFTAPSGYTGTLSNIGNDGFDSDGDPLTGGTGPITVNAGDTITNVDAGFWQPASLGDRVWEDLNHDGIQDVGEPGIAGVLVTLQTPNGIVTTTTDSSGNYSFTNLISGTYGVTFTAPSGYTGTLANVGNDSFDSDGNPLTGGTGPVTVNAGDAITNVDAGFWQPASLGDRVWEDLNHDGIQDVGEPGIPGVLVTLQTPNGTISTQTDVNGNYTFTNLISGTYGVTFTAPSGYTGTLANVGNDGFDSDGNPLTGGTGPITVNAGDAITNVDAGFWQPASLGDRVWEDLNHDGVQDVGEPGISGVLVTLQTPNGIVTTTTDSSGNYSFTNLISGTYALTFTAPSGYAGTLQGSKNPNDGNNSDSNANPITGGTGSFSVTPGSNNPTVDAGFWRSTGLGDTVWEDLNHDGIQDVGEPGIPGVKVTLTDAKGMTTTVLTDAMGHYTFTNLVAGVPYTVTFSTPNGYAPTTTNVGGKEGDTKDSDGTVVVVVLQPGEMNPTIDSGFWRPASLGDLVWFDSNRDGVQQGVEVGTPGTSEVKGVAGVVVTLYDASLNTIVATTTTDMQGRYLFDNLVPGSYFVEFAVPPGYEVSPRDVISGTDSFDSDADATTNMRTSVTTLESGEHDPTLDLGLYLPDNVQPVGIGNRVWYDANQDGVQDDNETGVPGVTVILHREDGSVVATVTTDSNGDYRFTGLPAGSYYVEFVPPAGYLVSPQNELDSRDPDASDNFDSDVDPVTMRTEITELTEGELDLSWDLGLSLNTEPASIGDRVWYDADADGIQDSNEVGVPGVQVTLYKADGTKVAVTTTDAQGNYLFSNLPPGDYYLAFESPAGFVSTDSNQGGNAELDSDVDPITLRTPLTTLLAGENDMSWDYGIFTVDVHGLAQQPASIGHLVWDDTNKNGIQDSDEEGIAGVTVKLYDENGLLIATVQTDSNGNYQFDGLAAGNYYVEFVPPVGYEMSPTHSGTNDTLDSDLDPATGRTPITTLEPGEFDSTLDAGFFKTPLADDETDEPNAPMAPNKVFLPMVAR